MTGKSKDNKYKYLFVCEVGDMTPAKYQFLDDAKTLVVSEGYIPNDYKMPFAVSARPILNGLLEKGFKLVQNKEYYPYIKGKKKFAKILVQKS